MRTPEDLEMAGSGLSKEEWQTLAEQYCNWNNGTAPGDYNQLILFKNENSYSAVLDDGTRWKTGMTAESKTLLALKLARKMITMLERLDDDNPPPQDEPTNEFELWELWQRAGW